jgi:dienelactone hydrolase
VRGTPRGLRRVPGFGAGSRELRTRPVLLNTADGNHWDAMLFEPGGATRHGAVAMVVHGSVGNYLAGFPRALAFGLAQCGHVVLSINTRMANYGVIFGGGIFPETVQDIDAGLAALRRLGYRRVVLCGYSMGASMVVHHQATRRAPEVVGLCTFAHPYSLPGALRLRWERYGSVPSYAEMTDRARAALAEDPDGLSGDRIVVVRRANGSGDGPDHTEVWTYSTWWHSRGPEATAARSWYWIGRAGVPVALVQAGADRLIEPDSGDRLAREARRGGVPRADVYVIAGADHVFTGYEQHAVRVGSRWISSLDGE